MIKRIRAFFRWLCSCEPRPQPVEQPQGLPADILMAANAPQPAAAEPAPVMTPVEPPQPVTGEDSPEQVNDRTNKEVIQIVYFLLRKDYANAMEYLVYTARDINHLNLVALWLINSAKNSGLDLREFEVLRDRFALYSQSLAGVSVGDERVLLRIREVSGLLNSLVVLAVNSRDA